MGLGKNIHLCSLCSLNKDGLLEIRAVRVFVVLLALENL